MSDSDSDYGPSPRQWVRDQVEVYERSGGTEGTELQGKPTVVITMTGAHTGKTRKVPVMRVEHDGSYAAVASRGGAAENPLWYANLVANPRVRLQDGPAVRDLVAREVSGAEKALWWERSVEVWPDYAEYQKKTDRQIPVFVLEPDSK
jgi:F420H(2)-dependent quinone reductase